MWFDDSIRDNRTDFLVRVADISAELGIDPNWLMSVMYFESRMNPKAVNRFSNATGLIQFMPSTAKNLGTSIEELKGMNSLEQLEYVYLYYRPYAGKMESITDCYLAVFFPAAIGKPDSYVIQTSRLPAELIAKQNPAFDLNKDSQVTKGEIKTYFTNWLSRQGIVTRKSGNYLAVTVGLILLGGIYFLTK